MQLSRYKFYVSGDFSEFWVEAEIPDLYLSDNISGQAISSDTDANHGKKFKYDRDKGLYYYETTASEEVGTTGDFQISLNPGNYTEWKKGLLYIPGHDYTDSSQAKTEEKNINVYTTNNPVQYDLTRVAADNTDGHWMTINGWVNGAKDYMVYVSGDLSMVWVKSRRANVQPMYIIGHLVNNLRNGYDYHTANTSILPMEYDDEHDYYKFTMAGARWSVFELSETAGPCYYNEWVDGMYAFMPNPGGVPITQPVLATNPFNGDEADFIKYPATKGKYYANNPEHDLHMRDMSIEGYNPDWLYTVYINGDKTKIWVTEQPINMPLKAMDFIDDSDIYNVKAIPHYFVVGTRTADWRLLPEWEFKPGVDATDMFISGRFMYDGYFAIAKVDNYLDYIHHRYQVFSNGNADQDYKIYPENARLIESDGDHNYPLHAIALQDKGRSHAMHYDEGDYLSNGTPIHDIHNSITWDIGVGATASQSGVVNTDMMRYALPFRFSRLTLTLDADGNPIQLQPTGSYNRKIINKYRTFVLMGSDINYEHEYDFNNCLGVRDVRAMTPAYQAAHTHELNWANSWISWDATHTPYYDAFQNTLFVTAYDKDWQNSALTLLDTEEGAGNWVEYSSDHMVFELADPDNDPEYGWVYRNHPSSVSGLITNGSDIIGYKAKPGEEGEWNNTTYSWNREPGEGEYNIVSDFTSDSGYMYQERIANYDSNSPVLTDHGNKLGDNGAPQEATETKSATDGWVCYVLKNVSFKGDFIVTSGWGGNLATSEGHGALVGEDNMPRNDLRLYFGNFSPRRSKMVNGEYTGGHVSYDEDTWAYTVRGFDLNTTAETEDASDNIKLGYRTYRDIDETNFCTQGTNYEQKRDESNNLLYHPDGTPVMTNTATLQNFDRIILWYNTNVDRTSAEIPNGVIQFVQSSIAPNARMHLTPGSTNKFTVNWNIIDNTVEAGQTSNYADWGVVSYTIRRYRYVLSLAEGERNAQLYREFETVYPDNMTVDNLLSGNMTFNDPYMLSPGSYFYTVEVTIQNPIDGADVRTRTATTNTMTIAEPGKTASIDMEQVMTRDLQRNNLYTFNVKATTRLTSNSTILLTESSHETAVWKDAGYLEISAADDATLAALNNATSVEIANKDRMQIWNKGGTGFGQYRDGSINTEVFKLNHPFDEDATSDRVDYIGWGLDPAYADANGNPKFVDGKIRFNMQKFYWSEDTESEYWRYFTTLTLMKQCELPIIVWHNVKPNENVVGETADNNQYKLNVYLGPVTGANKVFYDAEHFVEISLEDYWKTYLKFTPDDASTGVYAPAPQITIQPYIGKSEHQGDYTGFDHANATHIAAQPVGAHGNTGAGIVAQAPAYYTDLNEVGARITTFIPLDNEVLQNVKIGYDNVQITNVTGGVATPQCNIAPGNYKANGKYTTDINAVMHHLPLGQQALDADAIKLGNQSQGSYSGHYVLPINSISYRLNSEPKYEINSGIWSVSPANTRTASGSLSLENLDNISFHDVNHQFAVYTDDYLKELSPDQTKPYYGIRMFGGIMPLGNTVDLLSNLNAYVGFNVEAEAVDDDRVINANTVSALQNLGNHVQGGCPIHEEADAQGYIKNWQGLWNPQTVYPWVEYSTDNITPVVSPIEGYSKYASGTYETKHNWSRLAAQQNYLAFAYGPMALSDNWEKVYWPQYKLSVTPYVTLPFVPTSEAYISVGATDASAPANAPMHAPQTPAQIGHLNIIPLTFQATPIDYQKANIMTDIEGVNVDPYEGAVFYNMQGVEVPNPQHGQIYLIKRNGKVTREVYLK